MTRPTFLDLPARSARPRRAGVTHVLDKATPLSLLEAYLDQNQASIDLVKIGWGLGYLDEYLAGRVASCRRRGIILVTGGTLFELAVQNGRVDEFHAWAAGLGIAAVEVSNGLGLMRRAEKHAFIERLSADFVVLAETGSKDGSVTTKPQDWADEMATDRAAGASWVIAEGRESGTVGLYRPDGSIRGEIVDAVLDRIDPGSVIFEAPQKAQQLWLIRHVGPDVGLGNIDLSDVASLETMRVGLRADTALGHLRTGTA